MKRKTPRGPQDCQVVINFPPYFTGRSSMGVFYKDLYWAFVKRGLRVAAACEQQPDEIPAESHIAYVSPNEKRLTRVARYYSQLTSFLMANPKAILLNISQEYAFTPFPNRTAVIVHDLIQLAHPRSRLIASYIRWMLLFIRCSNLRIAISHTTRELLERHGIKSEVAYNWFNLDLPEADSGTSGPNFDGLFIGTLLPHKNFQMFERLAASFPNQAFAAVLPGSDAAALTQRTDLPKNLAILSGLTDKQYATTIAHSHVLVSTSLDEGFGRPPMEAAILGRHVLLSDIPVFEEIYEGIGHFFRSNDQFDLERKFSELMSLDPGTYDQVRRHQMVEKRCGTTDAFVDIVLSRFKQLQVSA